MLTNEEKLASAVAQGWRVSPLATAVKLSTHEDVPYEKFAHVKLISDAIRKAVMTGGRLVIEAPPQHGKPVEINELVRMGAGGFEKRLGDIQVGDQVTSHLGRSRRVTAVHEQGILPTLSVHTASGRVVRAAPDHPFLTHRGWVRISKLRQGDNLCVESSFGYTPDEVLFIREEKEAPCRCLTVEEDETFLVRDIVVHNSELTSRWTPVWFLENWPHKSIINCGYGKGFSKAWGRAVRNTISRCQEDLSFRLSADSAAADSWNTDHGGGMLCVGIGSGVTGRKAQLLIIDDPIKSWEEANSFNHREKVWNWYTSEASTRVHPGAAKILIMTRWNEDDLAGRLLKRMDEDWKVLELPAIYDEQAAEKGPDPLGRAVGEALWPERRPLSFLATHKKQSPEVWSSLYQQRPGTTAGLGNVYHSFKPSRNVQHADRDYQTRLVWSLDFNIEPMCSVIAQYREWFGPTSYLTNEKYRIVEVLDEICVNAMSTLEACQEFMVRVRRICGNQPFHLEVYGDPGGRQRHTSQVAGSDWDQITDFFRHQHGFTTDICVKTSAPAVKDRTNAVNAMLFNTLGEVQLTINPQCKQLKRDLENVKWKRDMAGNVLGTLDKSQKDLTHISDALGYFIETKWGRVSTSDSGVGIMQ